MIYYGKDCKVGDEVDGLVPDHTCIVSEVWTDRFEAAPVGTAPHLTWVNPLCSNCLMETSHDGDNYICNLCSVMFPPLPIGNEREGQWM